MIAPWIPVSEKIETQNRIFTLKTRMARSPRTGRNHEFYVLEAGEWVNVIPVTAAGRILLVQQYRHGTSEVTLEIPGGLIEPGQTPAEAAVRELAEETGYRPGRLTCLGRVRPNPAILNNWCHMYLAEDVWPAGPATPDEAEDIELVEAGPDEVQGLIRAGRIDHALVLSAFLLYFQIGSQTRSGEDVPE
jgi:8-oxo-dGTP pyrophosphatase MutT (NUDIX family)